VGQVEQRGQRRKDGVPAHAANALGSLGQVDQGCQDWGVSAATFLANRVLAVGQQERGAG
jgi:hypothetical protein